jgi:hypothetical protein
MMSNELPKQRTSEQTIFGIAIGQNFVIGKLFRFRFKSIICFQPKTNRKPKYYFFNGNDILQIKF